VPGLQPLAREAVREHRHEYADPGFAEEVGRLGHVPGDGLLREDPCELFGQAIGCLVDVMPGDGVECLGTLILLSTASGVAATMIGSCFAGRSDLTALTIAPCIPSATSCVNSTETSSKPAASSPLVLALRERAGDAADVGSALRTLVRCRRSSATTSEIPSRPPGFSTRAISSAPRLVDGEVDHAVRDDDVDRLGWQGICSITPFRKMDVREPASAAFAARGRASRRSSRARRRFRSADAPGREDHVDPATRAEVEHDSPS
jgi:hypothetical protein